MASLAPLSRRDTAVVASGPKCYMLDTQVRFLAICWRFSVGGAFFDNESRKPAVTIARPGPRPISSTLSLGGTVSTLANGLAVGPNGLSVAFSTSSMLCRLVASW